MNVSREQRPLPALAVRARIDGETVLDHTQRGRGAEQPPRPHGMMKVRIGARHLELTDALRAHVEEKIGRMERFEPRVIDADVELTLDTSRPGQEFVARVNLSVPGPDLHAEESSSDMYVSIDQVADKLERMLVKRNNRMRDKRVRTAARQAELQREVE